MSLKKNHRCLYNNTKYKRNSASQTTSVGVQVGTLLFTDWRNLEKREGGRKKPGKCQVDTGLGGGVDCQMGGVSDKDKR